MILSLNIALNNSFSSKLDLNDELYIATSMNHQTGASATDIDLSIESNVSDNILLLLRPSGNASILLLLQYKVDTESLFSTTIVTV